MPDTQRRRTLVFLAGAIIALVLLAGGLSSLQFGPGDALPIGAFLALILPSGAQSTSSTTTDLTRILLIGIFWVLLPIVVIGLVVSPDLRRYLIRRLPAYALLAIVMYLLLRVFRDLPFADRNRTTATGDMNAPPALPDASALPAMPSYINNPPPWFVLIVTLVLVAAIGLIVWRVWQHGGRPRVLPPLDRLTDEAQSALDDLRAGADVRDTVLHCYSEMISILRDSRGIKRGTAMTAREFEQQLRVIGISDEHIAQLTRLFERVRYGGAASNDRDARAAESCLVALVQAYGRGAS